MKIDARFWQLRSSRCRSILFVTVLAMALCLAAPFADAQSTGGRPPRTGGEDRGGGGANARATRNKQGSPAKRGGPKGATSEYAFFGVTVWAYPNETQRER